MLLLNDILIIHVLTNDFEKNIGFVILHTKRNVKRLIILIVIV